MEDLFDQLKSAGPIKKSKSSPAKSDSKSNSNYVSTLKQFNDAHISMSSSMRRESLPSPVTVSTALKKAKSKKARSLSPPKYGAKNVVKTLKVKLERKKLETFLTRPLEEHASDIRKKQEMFKDGKIHQKVTPTKAQQKLFEPLLSEKKSKTQTVKQFNIKPCKVRLRRDNLEKLSKEFKNGNSFKKDSKSKSNKRPAPSTLTESPPSKKSAVDKSNKNRNNFFIKLNTSPNTKEKKKNIIRSSPSSEARHNKIKNSKFNTATAPTKFSRSELFRSFGRRFFNVQVKIERCTHPLMLTFESNDRARRLQAKRNKSKNLSVSFSEQVEIFGGSSDSDDSCVEDFCAIPNNRSNRKVNVGNSVPVPATPVVMPARLKKVENGKVVDDIELDPSLFLDPKMLVTSTPFSPGRKKRDHKSFSPLKDENTQSPRKEKLKLANEGIPPGGLKPLDMEEDDEDDDCEYIVPIEMPQRRTSRTSSNASLDDLDLTSLHVPDSPINFPLIFNADPITKKNDAEINKYTKNNAENQNSGTPFSETTLENGSNDSFLSAKENLENNNETNPGNNECPPLRCSQTPELELEKSKSHENGQLQQTNGNMCNDVSKHLNTLNAIDDISMNSFLEDSQTQNHLSTG